MFNPREIVYGYAKRLYKPHNKYIITIYRDEQLSIIVCFTTSQARSGSSEPHHGANYIGDDCQSYVFDAEVVIGTDPRNGQPFSFPKQTVVTFDYGVADTSLDKVSDAIDNPEVVCIMDEAEYIELVYAMYKSPKTNQPRREILGKILTDYYSKQQ
jgi:hypothetical protein